MGMHHFDSDSSSDQADYDGRPWYASMTRYHWFVLVVAALGWLFDCLDQQLFILARPQAMGELLGYLKGSYTPQAFSQLTQKWGDISTSVFIAGWATGGLFFGMLGDRIGRAKTMMITILMYSACTGLSALSTSVYDFAFYRFLTGLGVGGEFAVGVALVAEVMPARARPQALSLLQALSAFGNISAALINWQLGLMDGEGLPTSPWRIMFLIGALPALLALVVRKSLKEPETWQKTAQEGQQVRSRGSYLELFVDPRWRRNAICGLILACSGVIGLWSVGFYSPDLIRLVQTKPVTAAAYQNAIALAESANDDSQVAILQEIQEFKKTAAKGAEMPEHLREVHSKLEKVIKQEITKYQSLVSIALNIGAFCGMFGFGALSQRIGRKPTFVIGLLAAFASTVTVFFLLQELWQIFVLVPIMGFCQLSLFGGYAIYFPELFPTRLRSTGTSFCYNVGRFIAAFGPLVKMFLNETFFKNFPEPDNLRYAGISMCFVFLLGLVVLPLLPETRGEPLPE